MVTDKCIKFLSCPIDGREMNYDDKTVSCPEGHSFDISREGYINLLTNKKRFDKNVGDNMEMLLAREGFLKKGYYNFLSEKINELIIKHLRESGEDLASNEKTACILEVGSGIAFYLKNLKVAVDGKFHDNDFCYFGTDISKEAVRFSAKKHKDMTFLVADTYSNIPIKNGSVSIILNIFSPRNSSEFKRLLNNRGLVVSVIPNSDHLKEIVDEFQLVGIEKDKKEHVSGQFLESFNKVGEYNCKRKILVDGDAIGEIIKMGPSYHHVENEVLQEIRRIKNKEITASFNILLYRPRVL